MNTTNQHSAWFPARGKMQVSEQKARKTPNVSGNWTWVVVSMTTGNALALAQHKAVAVRTRSAMGVGLLASREYYETIRKMAELMGFRKVAM